jgi:aspartokinase-like uncharacterized kinase
MTEAGPVVVKLGGSLAASSHLPALLRSLGRVAGDGLPIVIVPGGGPFADAVRTAQQDCGFDDAAAHDMALLGMAQYGRLLGALAPETTRLAWGAADAATNLAANLANFRAGHPGQAIVWLPEPRRDALDVERSWCIGADALALWLADYLGARQVILVKSCPPPTEQSVAALAVAGIVDAAYPDLAAQRPKVATTLVYAANAAALEETLAAFSRS